MIVTYQKNLNTGYGNYKKDLEYKVPKISNKTFKGKWLNDLPLGYIKKVESLFTKMKIKMCSPQESNRLDGGTKYKK